jgi:hypothetical protein
MDDSDFSPLSNFDIQNQLKDIPHFSGVFSKNQLPNKIQDNENGVINLADSDNPGTHWVCYYNRSDLDYVLYFDSYGLPPPAEVESYLKSSRKQVQYNTSEIQTLDTVLCGVYCIYVIKELDKGRNYYDILFDKFDPYPTPDNENFIQSVAKRYDLTSSDLV